MTQEDLMQIKALLDAQKQELMDRMDQQRDELMDRMDQQKQDLLDAMQSQKEELLDIMAIREKQAEQRIMDAVSARIEITMENVVNRKYALLAEGQQAILDKYFNGPTTQELDRRVDYLETMSRKHEREIQELKQA